MLIRTKAILFFGGVIIFLAVMMVSYFELSVSKEFKAQVQNSIRVIAEQNELIYFGFIAKLEESALNWSSDKQIKDLTEKIVDKTLSASDRKLAADNLGQYLRNNKLLYNKTVFAVDILNENGEVVASSRQSRIGENEGEEEKDNNKVFFSKALNAKFGEVFTKSVVFEEEESPDPMFHVTTRMFSTVKDSKGNFKPLKAVMLIHFTALQDLQDQFFGKTKDQTSTALSSVQFGQSYKTAETFLVNFDRRNVLSSPHNTSTMVNKNDTIKTKPIEDCFNKGQEVSGEYLNSKGVLVVGASVCLLESGAVLVNEVSASELYSTIDNLILNTIIWGLAIFLVVLLVAYLASRNLLIRLFDIVSASKKISQGDLQTYIKEEGEDEISILAKSFNKMTLSLKDARSDLEKKVRDRTALLEKEKKNSEATVEELKKFKKAIENANDLIVITDPEGKILFANPATEKMTGYDQRDIIGATMALWGKQMPEEFYKKLWKTIKTDKQNFSGEITNIRKSGEFYQVFANISSILDEKDEVKFFVALERDITKEKEIDKQKTEFVSLASHQLKTPLGSVGWATEALLNNDYGKLTSKAKKVIEDIALTNLRMKNLVEAFLNVSRIDLGTFTIETEPVNFDKICDEVVNEMTPKVLVKNLKIIKNYDSNLPQIPADPNLLRIIFQNFLSNSVKYAPEDSVVNVSLKIDSKKILFSVANGGIPIPKNEQSKIYSKLFRSSDAQERDPDGNGLGLYLVKSIVENGGGKTWFESEEGKDTIFYVSFPITGMKNRKGNAKLR